MSDSLEFRLLRYIVAVAETSNFTRAAERLFLAQPSLSKQIRDLEDDIGFPIFDRGQRGLTITPAGEMVVAYAKEALAARDELLTMARAVHQGDVPPLRLGFSPFVNAALLQSFRETYCGMFPECELQLSGGDPAQILARIDVHSVDCAVLQMPIDNDLFHVQQISQSPLAICLRADDPLAQHTKLDLHEIAERIRVFADPQLHPAAHSRLLRMFAEQGIAIQVGSTATSPSDIQWLVKAGYGLALIDSLLPIDSQLTTRTLIGLDWTVDTAFVYRSRTDHIALPFIERTFAQRWRNGDRKKKAASSVVSEQLRLLA